MLEDQPQHPVSFMISDNRRKLEMGAVVLTALGKFVFMDMLQWRLPFIMIVIALWIFYVIRRRSQMPGVLTYWGFRRDTFRAVLRIVRPFAIVALVACFAVGYFRETLNLTWHIFPVLLLYPIWGTIQQFLTMALVAGNLRDLQQHNFSNAAIVFISALLFGLMHYPYVWLMVGTFLLALLYGFVYLKSRNVYVLGIFHGWLGAVFFYTVVGRDPFLEIFGEL